METTDTTRRRGVLPVVAAACAGLLLLAACTDAATSSAPAPTAATSEDMASASAAASEDGSAGGETVSITGTSFGVAELTVAAGDMVAFTNDSSLPHTVTEGEDGQAIDDPRVDEDLPVGQSVDVTFDEAGDYSITCEFHGNMNMVVHVE